MLKQIRAIISDMDGVLWRGLQPLPGLREFFAYLFDKNIGFVLATNNSSKTRMDYVDKLATLGVNGVQPAHIVTSATATASFLRTKHPPGTRIFVLGSAGLKQILRKAGFMLVEDDAELVVCGIDTDLTYQKARKATLLIRGGAGFIGTNPDSSFPAPEGLVPGAGSILALIEAASGQPPIIIGKPERGMFEAALGQLDADPKETLMIGDRIGTDIQGARALGIKTALVMTGVEDETSLAESPTKPDFVFEGLPDLIQALKNAD
ncbi:MAG: HAD-IIA family hydrolase [Chloroflexota bacterium]|nr:HAD-IIA family hydrolase [Chloroflexota bacterium]